MGTKRSRQENNAVMIKNGGKKRKKIEMRDENREELGGKIKEDKAVTEKISHCVSILSLTGNCLSSSFVSCLMLPVFIYP